MSSFAKQLLKLQFTDLKLHFTKFSWLEVYKKLSFAELSIGGLK
jgi:hypothetical protein